jgi:hypothetical protein
VSDHAHLSESLRVAVVVDGAPKPARQDNNHKMQRGNRP